MKKIFWLGLSLVITCLITACIRAPLNTINQVSTIDALLAGSYEGQIPLEKLLTYGNFGIGTFDNLDGEMILLEGQVFQVKADGKIYRPSLKVTTPFASVVQFKADYSFPITKETDLKGLEKMIEDSNPNKNLFYALKIKGTFQTMKTRSVPVQKKPYPPLSAVAKTQPVFTFEAVSGTLVGFRSPVFVKGINVPGDHLHFISNDLQSGGHVLDFRLLKGTVEIDVCNQFFMILPEEGGSFSQVDLGRDRSKELEKVER
ncbi:MAG: alpha-acetolactate decarboxylase [Deltaproteobacteria bacterium RBG_13_43_22]|jgi:acetolactate decarboxylase|nr:MAG: alpha-acetolactate decarboxylase [Deltaproteobacteria bacterium RBG_13_43_22]